jgi:hypothetical protein
MRPETPNPKVQPRSSLVRFALSDLRRRATTFNVLLK